MFFTFLFLIFLYITLLTVAGDLVALLQQTIALAFIGQFRRGLQLFFHVVCHVLPLIDCKSAIGVVCLSVCLSVCSHSSDRLVKCDETIIASQFFYRATHMHTAVYAAMRCPSVCLSHACTLCRNITPHHQAISTAWTLV